ncbi:Plakophilin-1 [Pteropus alecto]|uniref:Plakophilin-1 n=1 Tax=Pteropus alecto TaxID=9402 RepID=L5L6M4_PTEAL|nr:Plakophilin-1 [Pteropus alecto]
MNHSPLKTALAYECFQDQDNSTLALPSDQKMKTGTSGRQRVQEQVLMTVRRQKSKSSQSSTLSHSNRGSLYDGLADNYNNYGTANRSSYYSRFQAGPGSWAYPVTKEGGWVRLASSLASCSRCLGDTEPMMPLRPCAPQPHPFLLLQ